MYIPEYKICINGEWVIPSEYYKDHPIDYAILIKSYNKGDQSLSPYIPASTNEWDKVFIVGSLYANPYIDFPTYISGLNYTIVDTFAGTGFGAYYAKNNWYG